MANYMRSKPLACCLLNRFIRQNRRLPCALGYLEKPTRTTTSKHRIKHVWLWLVRTWTWLFLCKADGAPACGHFLKVHVVAVTALTRALVEPGNVSRAYRHYGTISDWSRRKKKETHMCHFVLARIPWLVKRYICMPAHKCEIHATFSSITN
jgi:hypothetical protein